MKKFLSFSFCLGLICLLLVGVTNAQITTYTIESASINITYETTNSVIKTIYYKNDSLFLATQDTTNYIYKVDSQITPYTLDNLHPYDIALLDDTHLLISTSNFYMYLYDLDTDENKQINIYVDENGDSSGLSPDERKIAISASGTAYVLWDNILAKLQLAQDGITYQLKHFLTLEYNNVDLNFQNGACFVDEMNNNLYFSINNEVYSVSIDSKTITKLDLNFADNITYISQDNNGNLYIASGNTLYKINGSIIASCTFNYALNNIYIDLIDGTVYTANGTNLYANTISNNFVTSLDKEIPPVNIRNLTATNTTISLIKITEQTPLYKYKSLLKIETTLDVDKTLLLLDSSDANFYYVYDNNYSLSSLGYVVGYVLKDKCSITGKSLPAEYTTSQVGKVVVNETKVFTIPSSVNMDDITHALTIGSLDYDQTATVIASPDYPIDSNGVVFIAIRFSVNNENVVGYVDSRTLLNVDNKSLPILPVANGSLRADATIYQDEKLEIEMDQLDKNTPIKILTTQNGVTKIQYFVNTESEQVVKTGYVKSSFVNDGNLTSIQIMGIILMGVSIIMAIIIAIVINKQKNKVKDE